VFLPEEVERLRDVLDRLGKELTTDAILLRWSEHDRLLNALSETMTKHNVRNSATAMMLLLDKTEEAMSAGSIESDAPAIHAGEDGASPSQRSKKPKAPAVK